MSQTKTKTQAPEAVEQPVFPVDLRALLAQRVETKVRRIHTQWFCFDLDVQTELRQTRTEFAQRLAEEAVRQQATDRPNRKYAAPAVLQDLASRVDELTAKSRQVGAMAVFQNLTSDQLTECRSKAREAGGAEFDYGRIVLLTAFLRWQTEDGTQIPADVLGRDDLDALLQPDVVEEGEWKPLANDIIAESTSVIDRPTSPAQ